MKWRDAVALLLWVAGSGCNAILGLNDLTVNEQSVSANGVAGQAAVQAGACSGNRECSERLTAAGSAQPTPAICLQGERRCVQLTSQDCGTVTGDYTDDGAIVIASLFSTTGAQATTNLHRQQAATMAVGEINAAGGIPTGPTSAGGRPLVMVSCDEAADLPRVAAHLIHELRVPAIVGPNTSQDTLDLSRMFSIEAGTLLISPTAVASSIEDLLDRDLTWLLVPSDVQRAPLMLDQINTLERQLSKERGRPLKLGVIYRDDALGIGTRVSLNELEFNDKALADPSNLGSQVRMDGYDFGRSEQSELVDAYSAFAPDIVVLAGTAESITQIMLPLEARWPSDATRPYYLLTDSSKVPELLMAAANDDDLRRRLRGTGVTPSQDSEPVYNAFRLDYGSTYPDGSVTYSGMGTAYDATYALGYALAATYDSASVTGASIARGLGRLSGGATVIEIGRTTILAAFQALVAGDAISAVGTFAPLGWNDNGAVSRGTLEIWCVAAGLPTPQFRGSGLTFDIGKQQLSGAFRACEP